MSDIQLYSIQNGVHELPSTSVALEKELQTVIEQNMFTFFGITFLKSEYAITNGRIDSLGLDENFCPVIFEYKRSTNENVINQGLFYLDWLMDHKADFKLLVIEALGMESADKVDWSMPQAICIANDFTKFDEHAVNQMQRNIKLVRYRKFGKELILFEHLNAPNARPVVENTTSLPIPEHTYSQKTFIHQYDNAPTRLQSIYQTIKDYMLSLGDDITENQLKLYVAFRKVRNIATVEIYQSKIILHLSLDPQTVTFEKGFSRDMRSIGHYGTGDVQITINSMDDFEKAKPLIDRAYHEG